MIQKTKFQEKDMDGDFALLLTSEELHTLELLIWHNETTFTDDAQG